MSPSRPHRRNVRRTAPGSRPGELHIDPEAAEPRISVIAFGPDEIREETISKLEEIERYREKFPVTWVNVEGLGDREILEGLGRIFSLHPLALEDVVNVPQRPKVEDFDDQLFIVFQMLTRQQQMEREQLSLCLGEGFVVTFQERPGDPFEGVRHRLRRTGVRIRQSGADYLAYALLDAAVDHFFPVLEQFQDDLEDLAEALREPMPTAVQRIQDTRSELQEARRAVAPVRDITRALQNDEWTLLSDTSRLFLRDCHDHALEAIDLLETCREIATGLMDIHLSTVSHQANQTMQVLTVIATIFMPLSFLAGIYGMNFDPAVSPWNMPELSWPFGYPLLLGVMLALALALVSIFWKKGWFD